MVDILKYLPREQLDTLLQHLQAQGYALIGPVKRDQAIVYEAIDGAEALPVGWCDEQSGGRYRLTETGDEAVFAYVVGPDSWKKYLFQNGETLFNALQGDDGELIFRSTSEAPGKRAFIGVRPCELQGIRVQDRVFLEDRYVDHGYARQREQVLMVAVNCTRAADTCFCVSVDSGPRAQAGFDLALTEVLEPSAHYFTLAVGSERGREVIAGLALADATQGQAQAAGVANDRARQQQRALETGGLKARLYENLDNDAYWDDVAERCLNCANCTLVCPTCFCSTVEEVTALDHDGASRVRYWDSCFNLEHSSIAGGSVRRSGQSRYRQWLTHKLASWQDQFDTLGCVGCGRCVTWCPVGIDITAEVARLPPTREGGA